MCIVEGRADAISYKRERVPQSLVRPLSRDPACLSLSPGRKAEVGGV